MVRCLTELTQIAGEVDPNILLNSKHLSDIMHVVREAAIHVSEKSLNS